jgi:hypothetical protein
MPTDAQQIVLIKSQTLAVIAQITASPKPSYRIDKQLVSWQQYLNQLQSTVAWCDQQLAAAAPFEIRSQGYT